jgi:hypothetical protein
MPAASGAREVLALRRRGLRFSFAAAGRTCLCHVEANLREVIRRNFDFSHFSFCAVNAVVCTRCHHFYVT